MEWETVIGLEIHAQLATKSKIFSGASTAYGAIANTQACAVDLGLPGVLPVLNREAVRMAVKFGLAIDAEIAPKSIFARKNYFYPDLPKGYQISQFERPVVGKGRVKIFVDGCEKTIGVTRAHLEEDAGKSLHEDFHGLTGIDLNRAGTPLLEIVSEPDLRSSREAAAYMKKIHALVRYLGICDGNLEEGSFRCDANVSVRPKGRKQLGTRTEIKNLNSFRFVEKAIHYEVGRQIDLIEGGGKVVQETRLYDADRDETRPMRSKEESNDYRYFPDPDLLPLEIEPAFLEEVRLELPELPDQKRQRFESGYRLGAADAAALTASREIADYYEATVKASGCDPKLCANWVIVDLTGALNKAGLELEDCPIGPERLAGLLQKIEDDTISGKIAKQIFEIMWQSGGDASSIIEEQGLRQISDTSALEKVIDRIIADHPEQLEQYRSGKEKLLGYFVGQVMKATEGKASPGEVNRLLKPKLDG
ncbi:MAG: Asp-tRNA(Asn)/Glu-tRNA(Gln) amidotransferase subunit GatB [Methylococcaceae bacterium]|nr:Asp-tRNA(Asn)/Glu-tRNA(Gln) amidotransferase subunit GatB [Methylococcaceae bacterium]MCI0732669.1 Asp-tRNA(Asn)/Glu-tRNA(Gln) amidotransferase subunit GatB [Methylococcaceae bacterium]